MFYYYGPCQDPDQIILTIKYFRLETLHNSFSVYVFSFTRAAVAMVTNFLMMPSLTSLSIGTAILTDWAHKN